MPSSEDKLWPRDKPPQFIGKLRVESSARLESARETKIASALPLSRVESALAQGRLKFWSNINPDKCSRTRPGRFLWYEGFAALQAMLVHERQRDRATHRRDAIQCVSLTVF